FALLLALCVFGQRPSFPPKTGVATPGVQIPIARLKPDAVFQVPGAPDWMAIDEHVWVSNEPKDTVSELDPKTNTVAATIAVGKAPRCIAAGEGAVWALNQGDGTVSRIDPKTNKVAATIDVGVPGGGGEIAAGEGSVWVTSFGYPLSRIDPASDKVVQQFVGA